MLWGCLAQPCQTLPILWYDQDMRGSGRIDVFECEDVVIFFHDGRRNFSCYNLVKDCSWLGVSYPSQPDCVPASIRFPFVESSKYLHDSEDSGCESRPRFFSILSMSQYTHLFMNSLKGGVCVDHALVPILNLGWNGLSINDIFLELWKHE